MFRRIWTPPFNYSGSRRFLKPLVQLCSQRTSATLTQKRDPTLAFTGTGGWLWRYIQPSDIHDIREICHRTIGKVDYIRSHLPQYLKDRRIYALGAEVDGRVVHASFLMSQDDGKTLYLFGGRTHPEFQGGHVKSSLLAVIKNLVIDSYEPNVTKWRCLTSPDFTASVKVLAYVGFQQTYCYQASSFQHNDPDKAAGKLHDLTQTMMASCNIKAIRSRSDSTLIGPAKVCDEIEIIDSHLVPAGVFLDPNCVYTANKDNVELLQNMGRQFFISGRRESQEWRPEVFSYGGITSLAVCPTWACTINTTEDPNECALLHVLTHAQLAIGRALESEDKEPVAQLICLFNSKPLKEQAHALLADLIGFEESTSLKGPGLTEPYAIFEGDGF